MISIRGRIAASFMVVIIFIVLVLGGLFIGTIRQYYYGGAQEALQQRAKLTSAFINKYLEGHSLYDKSRYILENVSKQDVTRVEIIDRNGLVLLDSYGFSPARYVHTPDAVAVLEGVGGGWIGTDPETHERVMALSRPILQSNRIVGAVRYSTSIEELDREVSAITWSAVGIGAAVVLLSLAISWLLARRIVRPVQELTLVAKQMAKGNFHKKARIRNEDEVGNLAVTLNYLADEVLRNDKMKNDFISSISHELRTPLTSIKGWSETLVSGNAGDDDETRMGLAVIASETNRLVGLVEDLLDFSKLHAGSLTMTPERVDMNRLLLELVRQFAQVSQQRKIVFATEVADEPAYVRGDPNRLKQIFINLLDNAMKFTPEGRSVRLAASRSGGRVVVTVADTGEGIDEDDLKYVTEKFYKGKSKRAGSGLGLSICKMIVELHEGELRLSSSPGEGTVVEVDLPALEGGG